MTCPACHRTIKEADQRTRTERGDRDQPSYIEDCCRHCAPDSQDDEQSRDAQCERRFQEAREV